MGYRDYSTAKAHIVDATGHGDFTTIQAAVTAASSGQTIFIRPGTYTENVTLKGGVNLTAFTADDINNVVIVGKCTLNTAGTVSCSGIQFETNSDFAIAVTGSAVSVMFFSSCFINATNNTGISFTTSNIGSAMKFRNSIFDLGTTGIAYWTNTTTGFMDIYACDFSNTGASAAVSSTSAGVIFIDYCYVRGPLSTSSTGIYQIHDSILDCVAVNAAVITTAGTNTANSLNNSTASSGTASALVIGAGTSIATTGTNFASSNTNVLTGAGTLQYAFVSFTGSSSGHNVTIETPFPTLI